MKTHREVFFTSLDNPVEGWILKYTSKRLASRFLNFIGIEWNEDYKKMSQFSYIYVKKIVIVNLDHSYIYLYEYTAIQRASVTVPTAIKKIQRIITATVSNVTFKSIQD